MSMIHFYQRFCMLYVLNIMHNNHPPRILGQVVEVSIGRGASASLEQLDEPLGLGIATESLGVYPLQPFKVSLLGFDKFC